RSISRGASDEKTLALSSKFRRPSAMSAASCSTRLRAPVISIFAIGYLHHSKYGRLAIFGQSRTYLWRAVRRRAQEACWSKPTRANRSEVDCPRPPVNDQLGHRLAGRWRVEHAPDAVPGRDIGAAYAWHRADHRQAVRRHRPEARLLGNGLRG